MLIEAKNSPIAPPIITTFFKAHLIILRENQAFNTFRRSYQGGVRVPEGGHGVAAWGTLRKDRWGLRKLLEADRSDNESEAGYFVLRDAEGRVFGII
jgi:hypothetical protein